MATILLMTFNPARTLGKGSKVKTSVKIAMQCAQEPARQGEGVPNAAEYGNTSGAKAPPPLVGSIIYAYYLYLCFGDSKGGQVEQNSFAGKRLLYFLLW